MLNTLWTLLPQIDCVFLIGLSLPSLLVMKEIYNLVHFRSEKKMNPHTSIRPRFYSAMQLPCETLDGLLISCPLPSCQDLGTSLLTRKAGGSFVSFMLCWEFPCLDSYWLESGTSWGPSLGRASPE